MHKIGKSNWHQNPVFVAVSMAVDLKIGQTRVSTVRIVQWTDSSQSHSPIVLVLDESGLVKAVRSSTKNGHLWNSVFSLALGSSRLLGMWHGFHELALHCLGESVRKHTEDVSYQSFTWRHLNTSLPLTRKASQNNMPFPLRSGFCAIVNRLYIDYVEMSCLSNLQEVESFSPLKMHRFDQPTQLIMFWF